MTQLGALVDFVGITAANLDDFEIALVEQIANDDLDSTFGNADVGGDVAEPCLGVARDVHEDMAVVAEKRPTHV